MQRNTTSLFNYRYKCDERFIWHMIMIKTMISLVYWTDDITTVRHKGHSTLDTSNVNLHIFAPIKFHKSTKLVSL